MRAKLSGLGQVLAVAFDSYERPVPSPVENLRPSRDTCEECHWPENFSGDRMKVMTKFAEDEENTPLKTILLLHIGGGSRGGSGIHSWHIDPAIRTTYVATDKERQDIARVRVEKADGTVTEYRAKGADAEEGLGEERVMDCIDCHNRPTHIFRMPGRAMDEAMVKGQIDLAIPYIKKVGAEALTQAKGADGDLDKIAKHLRSYYKEKHGDFYAAKRDDVDPAIRAIQAVYERNVFPKMGVTWGTYTSNIGHESAPGCFRCHDDHLVTEDGRTIGRDCDVCHAVLAWDEEDPEVLDDLNLQ